MTATAMLDLRRTDLRTTVLENTFWITSGEITEACDEKAAVLFSFKKLAGISPGYGNCAIIIREMVLEVLETFLGSGSVAAFLLGKGTLDTDAQATTHTTVDDNEYWEATEGAAAVINLGINYPVTSANYLTDWAARVHGEGYVITPADTVIPTVVAYLTNDTATLTQGRAYLHMLIDRIPLVG